MKKGQIYEGLVEKVVFPNKGIIRVDDGRTVVVKNVVPGQKISFSITKVRKGRGEGRLLEILEKSPMELEHVPCEHFGICGGCTFLNLAYEKQLELKSSRFENCWSQYAPLMNRNMAWRLLKSDLREFGEVLDNLNIEIKWNFLLETAIKTDRFHWVCIKEEVFMIL